MVCNTPGLIRAARITLLSILISQSYQKTDQIKVRNARIYTPFKRHLTIPLVQVIRIGLVIENGISTVQSVDSFIVQLGDGQAKDIKFADNMTLLVLWESNGECSITHTLWTISLTRYKG
jgi:hypothetical protein